MEAQAVVPVLSHTLGQQLRVRIVIAIPGTVNCEQQVCGFIIWKSTTLGKASKPPVTESVRKGGGVPPLSVNFFPFGFWEPTVR